MLNLLSGLIIICSCIKWHLLKLGPFTHLKIRYFYCDIHKFKGTQQKIIGYRNPNFWVKISATEVIHFLGYGYQYSVRLF